MGINQQSAPAQIVGSPPATAREPVSEWWWYPANPDPRNVEFESAALPAGYAWWADSSGGALAPHAAVNNVALTMDSSPATFVRYKIHTDRRRSWMQCQVPQGGQGGVPYGGVGYYLITPVTLTASDCMWTRIQLPLNWLSIGSGVNGPDCYLTIMGSVAGVPNRDNAIMIGFEGNNSAGGNCIGNMYVVNNAASSIVPLGSAFNSQGTTAGVGFRRRSSTNWSGQFLTTDVYRQVAEFSQSIFIAPFLNFTPTHLGWKFRSGNTQGYNPIFGADFLRFDHDVNTLPL